MTEKYNEKDKDSGNVYYAEFGKKSGRPKLINSANELSPTENSLYNIEDARKKRKKETDDDLVRRICERARRRRKFLDDPEDSL